MAIQEHEISFIPIEVPGMNVHMLPTQKFKTITIMVQIEQVLSKEVATKTALLSLVLKRATARFPEPQKLSEHLDHLYGAIFDVDVSKKGERQLLQIYMEVANERYLHNESSLVESAVQFVGDVMTRPLLVDGVFSTEIVESEKKSLQQRIESIINDKMRYANQRITEEMCKGEPYAVSPYGDVEDLQQIDAASLTEYYHTLLRENPIHLFIVGDVEASNVKEWITAHINLPERQPAAIPVTMQHTEEAVSEVKEVIDQLDVAQAKLNMGCRTHITYKDPEYPALLVYNGILGSFPHSKLFLNVREKASLAYYAVSRLESHKGILMMMSGIDSSNYEKAVTIIKEQMELMKKGTISEEEMSMTKATLYNQYKELLDSGRMMIEFAFNGIVSGNPRKLQDLLKEISEITIKDVQQVSEKVQLDTIYLLRDKKGV
ncbi:EF-P 5-aminopentanol modification-associated protein YfmF [Brevibacillus daliensis]|uniref:EF-P 5-aminopentanol modification-associated protein YfmF n=1 Tax=Brevibacillus daliensis TaxID=2892995 RepID=UPI001E4BB99B|nr:pitrilysin family protein [Brevibacillus daliensis]